MYSAGLPKTINVLIVDDERSTQRVLADALTRQGFTVTVERDGEWALRTFQKRNFDVVLLDLLLPAVSGYEVARQMLAMPKGNRVPIIMISGVYHSPLHQREAVEKHGAVAFLEKPIDIQTLYKTLRNVLGDRYPQLPMPDAVAAILEDPKTEEHLADPAAHEEKTHVEALARKQETSTTGYQIIRGDFSAHTFAEVLSEVYRWRGTGALLLRREKLKKIVYFQKGTPISIKSNLLSECLGRVMVTQKMISMAECEESLRRMKSSARQQGTVLIEMGCISPHNLQHALALQLKTKLLDVFSWDIGEYQFNPTAETPYAPIDLGLTPAEIIHEGVRASFDGQRLERWLGDVSEKYVCPALNPLHATQDARLGEEELALLSACNGTKTVRELRQLGILSQLNTDRLIYAMKCAQMIELKDRRQESVGPAFQWLKTRSNKPSESTPPPLPEKSSAVGSTKGPPPFPLPWEEPSARAQEKARRITQEIARANEAPRDPERRVLARSSSPLLPEIPGNVPLERLIAEDSVIRERLAAKVSALRRLDYFDMLGVPKDAGREDIKRAYFALAKEYHPDKHFSSSSAEIRQLAQQVYDLISTAHDTLADVSERDRYEKELAAGVKREVGFDVGKILAAEAKFQRGEELLETANWNGAWMLFKEAIELYPDEGEFHAFEGWARFRMAPEDESHIYDATLSLERALGLNPRLDKAYLFLGYIEQAKGRPDRAEKNFEKAIQCNPDCTEALHELRLLHRHGG